MQPKVARTGPRGGRELDGTFDTRHRSPPIARTACTRSREGHDPRTSFAPPHDVHRADRGEGRFLGDMRGALVWNDNC
jgi:hypothetical protein